MNDGDTKEIRAIIRYLIVGVLTTAVSLGCYYLCVMTIFEPTDPVQLQVANVVSWIAAVTFAYFSNRKFVFNSTNENRVREFISFYMARLTTLGMDILIMFIGVSVFNYNDKIIKMLVQIIVLISNYIFSKKLVFKQKA